jgi:hypothetical protein
VGWIEPSDTDGGAVGDFIFSSEEGADRFRRDITGVDYEANRCDRN